MPSPVVSGGKAVGEEGERSQGKHRRSQGKGEETERRGSPSIQITENK
jgi:hypothetical protein